MIAWNKKNSKQQQLQQMYTHVKYLHRLFLESIFYILLFLSGVSTQILIAL